MPALRTLGRSVDSAARAGRASQSRGLLSDAAVQKVFHHAPFDLRFMTHRWGVAAQSVRCTKVASKVLQPELPNEQHSLAHLVERYLGVALIKGAVRTSDWQAKRLSAEQVEYAANDVLHLLGLLDVLQQRLRNIARLGLYDACCAFLPQEFSWILWMPQTCSRASSGAPKTRQ